MQHSAGSGECLNVVTTSFISNHDVQAAAIMLYTQETCLYPRLNAALRNHDIRALEPFLPYVKLLLSGLYQLPLTHVQTYRGVKLELYEVGLSIATPILL